MIEWLKNWWVLFFGSAILLVIWVLPLIRKKFSRSISIPKIEPFLQNTTDIRIHLQSCLIEIRDLFVSSGFDQEVQLLDEKIAPKINAINTEIEDETKEE